ncbi:hypothetical protein DY000_02061997 [Brassica cretica]|uniref:CNNM transmembrane domain-containing protein n=1 Tax=Brassica cretica TaxID=69181 RepID=A0ABQ7AW18_BRACR|nr:hypothetical protein DY000_02061997 [Brassica cretica]
MLHVLKDYACVSRFLVLFAGIMSGLTLGLMSLGLVELEILQRSGTPNKKKQATLAFSDTASVQCCCNGDERIIWFLIKFIVSLEFALDQVYFFCLSVIETLFSSSLTGKKQYVTTLQAMAKRAKAELKGGTLKTVSDKGNGSNSAKSLTGSEKAKPLKKTELVKKPLPKMTKTPGKSVVEVKERKGPGSRGSQEIKDHGHVKFLLSGFLGSSPKTKQSFPQKQNSKSNQFAGSPVNQKHYLLSHQ